MANHVGPNGKCGICRHPDRTRLELMASGGASMLATARKFAVSPDAFYRHMRGHVSPARRAALVAGPLKIEELAARAADEGESLLEHLAALRALLYSQIATAAEANDCHAVGTLAGRVIETLRLLGQVAGTLTRASGVTINNNLFLSPAFVRLEQMLFVRLARFPEARSEVIAGLRQLEAQAAPMTEVQHDAAQ